MISERVLEWVTVFPLVVSSILLTSPFRLHLLVLFLNSQELLSIFHSVCSFPHKRGRVLPPKSVSLPTNLIWTEIGWRSFKEGRRECLPACHPALKRVGWSRSNYHAMDLSHLHPKSPSECESRNYLHKFPMRIRKLRSQARSRLGL